MADLEESEESGANMSEGLEALAEEITCPVCQEHFNDPRLLPCCHYYCRECVQLMVDKAGPGEPFCCPECRKETTLPKGGIDKFPAAFFVHRMKSAYTSLEKVHGKVEALCEMCSGAKVEAFCRQCTDFICADCVKSHSKLKVFSGHSVVSLEELKNSKQLRTGIDTAPLTCGEHAEPLKIFCFDCNCLICRDCTLVEHAGHKYDFVKKAATGCRMALQKRVAPLQLMQSSVSRACEEVRRTRSEISAQANDVAKVIKKSFREISEVLDQRERELLDKTSNLVHSKMRVLTAQEKTLKAVESEVQSILDLVRRSSEDASDEELMTVQMNLLSRVEEESSRCENVSLEVVEDANITVTVVSMETIDRLCREETGVDLLRVEPTKCSVEGSDLSNVEVGEPMRFEVHTAYITGSPSGGNVTVEAELTPLDGYSSSVRARGQYRSKGVYEVVYTPETRGFHQLSVTVNSKPIANSPFNCLVQIPPNKLGMNSRSFEGMRKPWGVAVTADGKILVTDWKSNKVVVFTKGGQRLEAIAPNCFYAPTGVAVNKQGSVYVADGSNALFKLDQSGRVLKSVTYKDFHFSEPAGVLVGRDGRVYVCDRGNHRIAVFTDELSLVTTLGRHGTGAGEFVLPEGIAQDPLTGKIYVSDYENHRIHVLTSDLEFLLVFGEEYLEAPNGICVDSNGHLYVSDFRKGCIVAFAVPSCEFITMFSLPGPDEGNPSGLAMDSDGYLYVCDFFNRRVVVF